MDIFLSHGYFIAEDEHEQQIMKPYPPLGLMYISSHLKAKGFAVELYDSTFSTLEQFEGRIRHQKPSLVGLYCNLMTRQNILRQIAICKEAGARVVLGGPEPVNYARAYLEAGADLVVDGEGELTLEEVIPHLARYGMADLERVPGVLYIDEDGRVARGPARQQIKDLSAQPWPDRQALDMSPYLETWKQHHGRSAVSLITARGCPYTCKWCSHSVFGYSHRRRQPEEVVEEVTWINEVYKPDQLWYADDVLTIHPRWFLKYAELLKERGLRLPFECISRADRLNEQIIDALVEMGCGRLWIGAESGSQRILDAMERKTDAEDIRQKTKMLQKRGIEVGMFIMLGYEGEDESDLQATVEHLKAANPDLFLTTVAYPIKGTAYYDEVEDRLLAEGEWPQRTDRDYGVAGRHSKRYYDQATRWMVNEVNLHKSRLAGSGNIPGQLKMYLNARRGRLGMLLARREREEEARKRSGRGWPARERAEKAW